MTHSSDEIVAKLSGKILRIFMRYVILALGSTLLSDLESFYLTKWSRQALLSGGYLL
jgi:hypothetical protein